MDIKEQFSHREKIQTPGGFVHIVDIHPKVPTKKRPLLLASGWGETLESLKDTINAFVDMGWRVIAADYSKLNYLPYVGRDFPASVYVKGLALVSLLDVKKIHEADVVAHSEGAINAVIASYLKPEKFTNIILVAPGGMMVRDDFFALAGRFLHNLFRMVKDIDKESGKSRFFYFKEIVGYFFTNPIQLLHEAVNIARFRIYELLPLIQDKGVRVYIIHGEKDIIFPAEDVVAAAKRLRVKSFHLVSGGHNEIHAHPKHFARLVGRTLNHISDIE